MSCLLLGVCITSWSRLIWVDRKLWWSSWLGRNSILYKTPQVRLAGNFFNLQERLARADILTVGLKDEGIRWREAQESARPMVWDFHPVDLPKSLKYYVLTCFNWYPLKMFWYIDSLNMFEHHLWYVLNWTSSLGLRAASVTISLPNVSRRETVSTIRQDIINLTGDAESLAVMFGLSRWITTMIN